MVVDTGQSLLLTASVRNTRTRPWRFVVRARVFVAKLNEASLGVLVCGTACGSFTNACSGDPDRGRGLICNTSTA